MRTVLLIMSILTIPVCALCQGLQDIDQSDDAVVLVNIFDYQGNFIGHGSGFIIDSKGTVVTNYHVIENAYSIKVKTEDGTEYEMDKIISGSKQKDLAKISLKTTSGKVFPYLSLSNDFPKKGEDCWAIGTPANPKYMNTVSKGLVSNILSNQSPIIIQTNAEITHGSSGGALLNKEGKVIGITSAGDPTEDGNRANINFAIWVGELNNLPLINKNRLLPDKPKLSRVSFYTNSAYTGDVFIFINNFYIGELTKYFPGNTEPDCGAIGTVSTTLQPGTYTYYINYSSLNRYSRGTITVLEGGCKKVKLKGLEEAQKEQQAAATGAKSAPLKPGTLVQDIIMPDPEGKIIKLSDLKGKVVLIDFWASWCGPCRIENPHVVKAYKKYNADGFEVFSVSLDEAKAKWIAAIAQEGLVWPNHVSSLEGWSNQAVTDYAIKSIPFTVLIDQEGKVIKTGLRGLQLEAELSRIFGH